MVVVEEGNAIGTVEEIFWAGLLRPGHYYQEADQRSCKSLQPVVLMFSAPHYFLLHYEKYFYKLCFSRYRNKEGGGGFTLLQNYV